MTEPKPTVNQMQYFQNNGNDPLKPASIVSPSSAMMLNNGAGTPALPALGRGKTSRGPRVITIQRSSAGFGFTLRHFIVYPPDSVSDCPEEWQRGMSAGLLDPMGPMDTIFVKHIRENGPAVKAGLNTGDQVVSVNGESVMCKSYAEVVGMIQKSGPTLHLVVLPKEHDVLQQCFADTAHNPHTNVRPAVAASQPEQQAAGITNKALMMSVTNQQQHHPASAGLVMDANALLKTNIMSHLPRPKPYQSFQVEAKKPQQAPGSVTSLNVHPVAPVTVPLPRQSSGSILLQQQPAPRVISPLIAGTGTVTSPPSRCSEEAQARLAAAAALVSKSVRKSADFNNVAASAAVTSSAGSRASLADYSGGSFDTASKRSSYAGTPSSRSEFILSGSHPIYSQPIYQQTSVPYGMTQGSQPSVVISQSSCYPLYESTHFSSPSLLNQHRDSITSSKGSLGEEQQQRDVMTRIKKSFEQKEEFLKRPALPYWVNVQESNQVPPTVPREFYAQPQKFSRPIWPPSHPSSVTASVESLPESPNNSSSSSIGKPTGITTSFLTSVEPWSMVFTACKGTPPPVSPIGLVTNTVPKPFYGSANNAGSTTGTQSPTGTKLFVSTLSRIQENIPTAGMDQRKKDLELKPRSSNAAPLASPEEFFTPSPTKSTQHPLAAVIKRAKQIEASNAEKAKQLAAVAQSNTTSPVILRTVKPVQIEVQLQRSAQQPAVAGSGNRTVIIGSSKLHCEPPPSDRNKPNMAMDLRAVDDPLARPFSPSPLDENSNSSNPKVVAAAVHHRQSTPRNELTARLLSPSCLQTDIDDVLMMDLANTSTNDEQELASLNGSGTSSTPITSDFELSVLERFDQLLASLGTRAHSSSGAGSSAGSSSTINGQEAAEQVAKVAATHSITASVNRRQKIYDDDSDRGMRRVSYLKATANPMDGTDVSSTSVSTDVSTNTPAQATTPIISEQAKGRQHPPHSIQKLRSLFGDKVATSATSSGKIEVTTNQNGHGNENLNSPSPPTESHSTREGWLHVKQTIVDCRRSTDRSWRQLWTRIRSSQVSFYREKPSVNGGAPGPDDMVLDLRICSIEVAIYYTKRKHVLRLSTSNGLCEYLLQCEDNNDMVLWLDSFQQEQMACCSEKEEGPMTSYSSSEMMLVRQAHEIDSALHQGSNSQRRGMGRFTLHRNRSPTGHSPVSKTRKPSLSSSVYHSGGSVNSGNTGESSPSSINTGGSNSNNNSHKPATWRRKVVQQFKKIQGNSPSYPSVGQYGSNPISSVPEGATIGVPLEFCPRSSLSDSIPLIVELCVGIVEARGLESVGVYRVPGNSIAVNALTDSLNRGFDSLNINDPRWNDVNVISSLMKSFFRKLPDPLVTSELYGSLIEASRTEPEEQRLVAIKRLVDDLPEPHYSTLRYLIGHLSRVAAQGAVNKMEARNLAIVFGPTLIRPGDDSTVTMVTDMSHQCRIVETLIDKVDYFFSSASELDQTDASITQQTSASTAEERKEAYARDIVSSIIAAVRSKKHSSLESPNLSDRNGSDLLLQVEEKREIPSGSVHSLVELGSTGGTPALPVEASEFREATALQERKRSASLGGEAALPLPTSAGGNMGELTGSTELVADGQLSSTPEFRSRTSSGTFVPIKVPSMPNPIDAAGIRSYSGLSAVTQERIRLFEQETKALLQRDLVARQRRDGDPCIPSPPSGHNPTGGRYHFKTEVDPAWNSKLEMETDDFLDALADCPSGRDEGLENQEASTVLEADHLDVDTVPATEEIEVKIEMKTVPVKSFEEDPVSIVSSTTENTTSEADVKKDEKVKTEVKVIRKNSGTKIPAKTHPVVAARSQVPKVSGAAATKSSESTTSRMPVRKTSTTTVPTPAVRSSTTGRASAPVAGRSRTVELGKVVGVTNSKKTDPTNRVVVRQMSSGALLPSTSNLANKMSKTAPTPSSKLRMKSESTQKNVIASSTTKNSEELKIDGNSLKSVNNTTIPSLPECNLLSSVGHQSKENRPLKEGNELGQPELLEEVGKVAIKWAVEGKDASRGVKRSDSLTKDEKTENNTKEKERSSGRSSRRFIQRGETGLKRRHTVGGTRDFDKVRIRWLADGKDGKSVVPAPRWSAWDRLQPLISDEDLNVDRSLKTWMRSERMRTSSPELCRRSDQGVATPFLAPTSVVQ